MSAITKETIRSSQVVEISDVSSDTKDFDVNSFFDPSYFTGSQTNEKKRKLYDVNNVTVRSTSISPEDGYAKSTDFFPKNPSPSTSSSAPPLTPSSTSASRTILVNGEPCQPTPKQAPASSSVSKKEEPQPVGMTQKEFDALLKKTFKANFEARNKNETMPFQGDCVIQ